VPSLTASSTPGSGRSRRRRTGRSGTCRRWPATRLATVSVAPKMASRVLGSPRRRRHLMVGRSAARAGGRRHRQRLPALACLGRNAVP
jgi:hypothetical protein